MKTQKWWAFGCPEWTAMWKYTLGCGFSDTHAVNTPVTSYLHVLDIKGPVGAFHANHSRRVAILGFEIAEFMHLDVKPLFLAGALHDIGKALIPHSTLGKEENWTEKDAKAMEPHVRRSYELLRDKFNFTAEIVLWHHRFQPHCYPKKMPPPLFEAGNASKVMIPFYGRLLMLADTYDALHRVNPKPKTQREIQSILVKNNPDLEALIMGLYEEKIFAPLGLDTELEVV